KAIVFHQHGGLDVLQPAELPTPPVGPNDVLVDVKAAALNRLDLFVREGWPGIKLTLPHIPGSDAAGIVSAVGANVTSIKPGQHVTIDPSLSCGECEYCLRGDQQMCVKYSILGEHVRGTYAEQVVVPLVNVLPMPDDFAFESAAAANLVAVTAWHSLIRKGQLRAGETVLIVGAGGGVNSISIQIAKLAGARVFVVASDAAKAQKAQALGADVVIDRSQEEWGKAVFNLTKRRGVDVVVDNVGAATWLTSIRSLARGGRMLVVGNTSGPKFEMDSRYMFTKHISIIGSTMGSHQDFRDVMRLVFERKIAAPVDHVLPLSEAREAQRLLQEGNVFGKIVLKP
ncbi:MAG: zinc-binding dehydrogenase, partial [Chloroflexota bacterium]